MSSRAKRYADGVGTVSSAQPFRRRAQAQLLQVQTEGAAQDAYQGLIAAMGISPLTLDQIAEIPGFGAEAAQRGDGSVERIVG